MVSNKLCFSCRRETTFILRVIAIISTLQAATFAQETLELLMKDIATGPSVYYSPEAYSFYSRKGEVLPTQKSRDEALRSFNAAIKIAAMGEKGREAIPTLLSTFPKAIHVTEVREINYTGEGTFEDWVQTYVTGEKNKFMLSPIFPESQTMQQCEPCVTSSCEVYKSSGALVTIPTRDLVSINVIHTVYFGACALAAITGEPPATDLAQWQAWWNEKGPAFIATPVSSTSAVVHTARLRSGQLFDEIVVRGKYRMFLSTGDNLTGIVEMKNDTSLVLETAEGKAFTFKPAIITRYEYLEPPRQSAASRALSNESDSLPFSFDELRSRQVGKRRIEVFLTSGTVFRGQLAQIDSQMLKLQVDNSIIPFTRDVVNRIRMVPSHPPTKQQLSAGAVREKKAVYDTVIVKNTKSDESGNTLADIIHVGTITADNSDNITISIPGIGEETIDRKRVVRVIKNSAGDYESVIKRYAEPLFCPQEMFLVDLPPGKQDRPFLKVCIDRYEFPNTKDQRPKTGVSYDEARELCRKQGKRLCTAEEWQWGCSGLEGYTYPYGWNPEKHKCNTDDQTLPEPSGARHNCISKFGGYDMAGNVFEWVVGPKKQPALVGGPLAKCQTITEGVGGSAKPRSGFRCCKSN